MLGNFKDLCRGYLSSTLDGRLSALPRSFLRNSTESRLAKVDAMLSFDVNVMTFSIFFEQRFELPTFRRSSAASHIERMQAKLGQIPTYIHT